MVVEGARFWDATEFAPAHDEVVTFRAFGVAQPARHQPFCSMIPATKLHDLCFGRSNIREDGCEK